MRLAYLLAAAVVGGGALAMIGIGDDPNPNVAVAADSAVDDAPPGSAMSGSDTSGSDLSGSDMSGSDMSGSDMSGGALPPGHPPIGDPLPPGHPPIDDGAPHAAVDAAPAPRAVEKAVGADAFTAAEIHAQAKQLDGRTVRLRGVVTKNTSGVLGRDWLHVQDASGEVVVTTERGAVVGTEVVVSGRLVADKDLGSGYRYDALIEDAVVEVR
jgi:hypothetical protein